MLHNYEQAGEMFVGDKEWCAACLLSPNVMVVLKPTPTTAPPSNTPHSRD